MTRTLGQVNFAVVSLIFVFACTVGVDLLTVSVGVMAGQNPDVDCVDRDF